MVFPSFLRVTMPPDTGAKITRAGGLTGSVEASGNGLAVQEGKGREAPFCCALWHVTVFRVTPWGHQKLSHGGTLAEPGTCTGLVLWISAFQYL